MRRLIAVTMFAWLAAVPADAGTKAVYEQAENKGSLTVEIADNGNVRIGPSDQSMYILLLGDSSYIVTIKDGKTTVARVADVAAAFDKVMPPIFGKIFGAAAKDTPKGPPPMEKIGPQTVNGRTGIAYKFKGGDPKEESPVLVLSDDPALQPVGRAMERFTEASVLMLAPLFGKGIESMIDDMRAVFAMGTPLRGGDGMTLKSVETADVPAARVALPAKPQTVDEIVKSIKLTPTN